jgi:putative pyruvate formate lyase activating enzyme
MRYFDLFQSGELLQRIRAAWQRLKSCDLCPHDCRVNRLVGETGICRSGALPKIASANVHRGEEPPISGSRGSGTIFFSNCNLSCRFCQNFPISQFGNGEELSIRELAGKMLKLQRQRVHNINLVTPSHFLPQFMAALYMAVKEGFSLPVVWNSNGYEKVDALQLLDGIVDIFLPDMKYADDAPARALSGAPDYPRINRLAVREMLRQVGHLQVDEGEIGTRGLIVRHLVLPNHLAGSVETLPWIGENLGEATHVALMSQYFPAHMAGTTPGIERPLTAHEYDAAVAALEEAGLECGWVQELEQERRPV